ncbi:unnamed protein product [Clonostachys solani]|uniref:Deacetylase sirtuin-type domain-containing protein n=1 Tax=Clonostachys solani TaxID=160281 RepID=A0A9P0EE59_9HYPO|nr:unnamed protein product [Clonostachys solani]
MSFYSRRPFWMRHTPYAVASRPSTSVEEFRHLLQSSTRILALCGAGLSAPSGLSTYRGAGGLWRNHSPASLATPEAFEDDPALVWLFYAWQKHVAIKASPNAGHYALAELAKRKEGFLCLTQNIDGLSPRAGHPLDQLKLLHGSILDLKCSDECGYFEKDNTDDPPCEALAEAAKNYPPDQTMPLVDPLKPLPSIREEDLPHCPQCQTGLLRPGVVWFGEAVNDSMLRGIDGWISEGSIDLMLVIGTGATVQPAASYVRQAQQAGAVVAVINPDAGTQAGLGRKDFFFRGDAAEFLPVLFEGVIGELREGQDLSMG